MRWTDCKEIFVFVGRHLVGNDRPRPFAHPGQIQAAVNKSKTSAQDTIWA